jgi:hypothetical protein
MPTTNPELSGARSSPPSRKRTLSTKAATNGDHNAERERQKLEEAQKKGMKTTCNESPSLFPFRLVTNVTL